MLVVNWAARTALFVTGMGEERVKGVIRAMEMDNKFVTVVMEVAESVVIDVKDLAESKVTQNL